MANNVDVPIRPVIKGITRNVADYQIPLGGFRTLINVLSTRFGIKKRGGLDVYNDISAVGYPPLRGIETFWKTDGTKLTVIFDSKFIYEVSTSGYTRQEWTYTIGTIGTSGTTVTGSGTLWDTTASDVAAGDLMVLDANGSGDGPEGILISSIANDTTITLASAPVGTYGAGSDYKIVRAFDLSTSKANLDWALRADVLYITDNVRPLIKWDGSTFSYVDSGNYKCKTVSYFKDRLFLGNTYNVSGGTFHKQRMRWGEVASETLSADGHTLDLPYTSDELIKLLPLGDFLVAYFEQSIWIGRPTNIGSALPYEFDQLPTGGIGLIGLKAVTTWTDGHFFIGQDNFYYLGVDTSLQPVGEPVFDVVESNTSKMYGSYVAVDPVNNMIVFGVPENVDNQLVNLYMFNYITKAWSNFNINVDFLGSVNIVDINTWDSTSGTWDDYTGTWNNASSGQDRYQLWTGKAGQLASFENTVLTDDGDNFIISIETGDIDLNAPNVNKGYFKMSFKIRDTYSNLYSSEDLTFLVEGSIDKGVNWKTLGTFSISDGFDEDKIFFRLLGAQARFRLSNHNVNFDMFEIEEFIISVKGKGIDVPGQQQG